MQSCAIMERELIAMETAKEMAQSQGLAMENLLMNAVEKTKR